MPSDSRLRLLSLQLNEEAFSVRCRLERHWLLGEAKPSLGRMKQIIEEMEQRGI